MLLLWIKVDSFISIILPNLNPICHLLALGAHHILHVGRIRVNVDKVVDPTHWLFLPSDWVDPRSIVLSEHKDVRGLNLWLYVLKLYTGWKWIFSGRLLCLWKEPLGFTGLEAEGLYWAPRHPLHILDTLLTELSRINKDPSVYDDFEV
jgi:hypothetical protein